MVTVLVCGIPPLQPREDEHREDRILFTYTPALHIKEHVFKEVYYRAAGRPYYS